MGDIIIHTFILVSLFSVVQFIYASYMTFKSDSFRKKSLLVRFVFSLILVLSFSILLIIILLILKIEL